MQHVARHIETRKGMEGLVEQLHHLLSGSELNTLLLELFRRRAGDRNAPQVLQQFASNRFCAPSPIEQLHYLQHDTGLVAKATAHGFRSLQLSPLAPLGTCSAVGLVDQNNVVSALRGTEVVADATNVLALQVALDTQKSRSKEPVKYCTVHRHVRSQALTEPWHTPHFSIFCAVTGGFDRGAYAFECAALRDHIDLYLSLLLDSFDAPNLVLRFYLKGQVPQFRGHLEEQLTGLPDGMALHLEEQPEPNAYYHTVQFKFFIRHQGAEINLIDGGFVPWTQDLLQNRKHRLLISGAGTDLMLKLKLGLI
ncbi:MAG TPA: hypothetical protein VGE66_08095 [Chitinophagaceae bacterium]